MILEEIYNSSEYTALIMSQTGKQVKGIITDGLNLSGSNVFESQFDLTKQQEVSKLFNKLKAGFGGAQSLFMHVNQTIKVWLSGGLSDLSVSLLIPNLKPNFLKKVLQDVSEIANPKVEGVQIYAPHNYSPDIKGDSGTKGTIALRYSTYFYTKFVLVISSYSIQTSSVIMEDGYPSYAIVNFTLTPYRLLGKDDIKGMWI